MRGLRVPGYPRLIDGLAVASVIFSMAWAIVCNLVLDLLQSGGNLPLLITHTIGATPVILLLNAGVVWCVLLLIWATVGKLWITTVLMIAATILLGWANHLKVSLRQEPLYPSDFGFASNTRFLTEMVGLGTVVSVFGFIALVTLVIVLSTRILRRKWKRHPNRSRHSLRVRLVARVCVTLMAVGVLGYASQFNKSGNRLRAAYEASDAKWAFWFQKRNYLANGFVAGVLYNLRVPAMERPPGYSKATMLEIAERYSLADHRNDKRSTGSVNDVNIVLVLSEAFSDPTWLNGVEYAEDPLPHTRKLMSETTSGRMLTQLYGGGTANMEFELLTGMSLSQFNPQLQTPYQMLVPNYSAFPSAVGYSKSQGHTPIAIHPYMTSMYKRETVYPILGFEDFLSEGELQEESKIDDGKFISDESAFNEVVYQIDKSSSPLLVNLVTMQNHWPMENQYEDPMAVEGPTGDAKKQAEGYGRGIQHTDEALNAFTKGLEDSEEKVAVVFYGDHLPAIWQQHITAQNSDVAMKSTPFFIWTNFTEQNVRLPQTSPIYFLPLLFDAIGAAMPPYYALLHELYQEIPAMAQDRYLDPDGRELTRDELSPTAKRILEDYRLVQYDLSVGARYSQAAMFYPPESVISSASE